MRAATLLGVAVGVALLAQFSLDSLADQTDVWHGAQHGLLFWGGLGAGVGLALLYRLGQRRA